MGKSIEELKAIRENMQGRMNLRKDDDSGIRVVVGMATCGIAAGARPVLNTFVEEISRRNLQNVTVTQTGCIGVCRLEPIVEVFEPDKEKVTYVNMDPAKAARVVSEHLVNKRIIGEYTIGVAESQK